MRSVYGFHSTGGTFELYGFSDTISILQILSKIQGSTAMGGGGG